MKAIQVHLPGAPESLVVAEIETPQPRPGEVRVRAVAIGAGYPDVLIRKGIYKFMPPLPAIPGNEMAGVVDAVGDGVTRFRPGDRAFVSSRELDQRGGCYAECICVPAAAPYALPPSISFEDAVSLGNFQLAIAMLLQTGSADERRSIFVPGSAGGVATSLIQVARHHGIDVVGTASTPEKARYAAEYGVGHLVHGAPLDLPEQVRRVTSGRGVDMAFDHLGGEMLVACIRSLAPLGLTISYNMLKGPPSSDVFLELRARIGDSLALRTFSIHTFDQSPARRRELMEQAIALLAAGHVRAPRITALPLADAVRAHEMLESGRTLGKIVLHP